MSDILLQSRDARGVVTLTLNDPARFNALGQEMLQALQEALDTLALDEQLRAVVLAAHGKAFCAGHNLKDMAAHPELSYYQQLFAQCSRMMLSITRLPVPVIARVQGLPRQQAVSWWRSAIWRWPVPRHVLPPVASTMAFSVRRPACRWCATCPSSTPWRCCSRATSLVHQKRRHVA